MIDVSKLLELPTTDLLRFNESEKQEVIMTSVEFYIQQVQLSALLMNYDFLSFLKFSIDNTEKEIQKLIQQEQYETCYYLQEIIKELKNRYGL
jgi:hypothetical protein